MPHVDARCLLVVQFLKTSSLAVVELVESRRPRQVIVASVTSELTCNKSLMIEQ